MSNGVGFGAGRKCDKRPEGRDKHVARADEWKPEEGGHTQRRALLPVPNTILGRSLARLHTSVTNMVKMHVTYCGG